MSAAPPSLPLLYRPLAWACAAFGGGLLLHLERVPPWASLAAAGLILWRLLGTRRRLWQPGTTTRAVLALGMAAVVLARFHTLNGIAAGTTLLLLMAALKLLEIRTARDLTVLVGAGFFLLLAACLDRQTLERAPLYAAQTWLCCAALAAITTPELRTREALALAGRALLLAAPLALALFVFFPRLPGAFWAIPAGNGARTGLSDSMTPGSISRLVADYDTAFRVRFEHPLPSGQPLYWRGPVLHQFDGQTWRRPPSTFQERQPLRFEGAAVRYRVSLEPTQQRYWFALDTPAQSPAPRVFLTYDYQLLATEAVSEPVNYEAVSYLHTQALEPLNEPARREDTALPASANPRTRALAQQLYLKAGSDSAFVSAALEYLRHGGFIYSLEPQPLGADAVDDLLFRTREGFCGHYASAFATLMRAGHVPARVVTGYLGGRRNPVGEFLEVRQSDAHAWTEVWLEGQGWTRIDPTAVVAPERLQRGLFELMPGAFSAAQRLLYGPGWLSGLLQRWDAVNAWWSDRVVNFNYESQLDLLERLGIRGADTRYLAWGFTAGLLGWLLIISWYLGRGARRPAPDPLGRAYLRLCRKLARITTARAPHQGPIEYAQTIAAQRPDLAAVVTPLCATYARLRYGPASPTSAAQVAAFARAVARLRLPRAAA